MNFYTLDSDFLKKDVIDELSSSIWTERYSTPGDVVLTMKVSPDAIQKLSEGTFLSLSGSKEVMILDTQLIENGVLKVSGKSLLEFTKERLVRDNVEHHYRTWAIPWVTKGETLGYIVEYMLIDGVAGEDVTTIGFDGGRQVIPNLTLGAIDTTGDVDSTTVPYGTVYDALTEVAQDEIGMSLYLDSANFSGYSLKFTAYRGRNLTSDQDDHPVVRFSPALESLTSIQELRSIAGYKNVAYAFANMNGVVIPPGIAYAHPDDWELTGFDRRTLMIFAEDMTGDFVPGTEATIGTLLELKAQNALANNNFTRVVDGEVVPQSQFKFGEHYLLGDIVELEGHSGFVQKARITEYIRTEDETGERAYPTVSIIE